MARTQFDFVPFMGEDKDGLFLANPYDDMSKTTCDIIFVHGLHGGAAKTWRHPDTDTIWFRDLLPDTIRRRVSGADARVWTYGYPATVFLQDFNLRVQAENLLANVKEIRRGHENKKIIWVCHSLGGILVKQALINAKLNNLFQSIGRNTVGIVFLGTPHRGSGAADLGNVAATIATCVVPGIKVFNPSALKTLRRNNDALFQMAGQFSNVCSDITIHSFHETMPFKGTRLVVTHHSAILQIRNEVKTYGLTANHQEMVRFRNGTDPNWRQVSSSICDLVLLTITSQSSRGQPQNQARPRNWSPNPAQQPSQSQQQPRPPPVPYPPSNQQNQGSSSYSDQSHSQNSQASGSSGYFGPSWQQQAQANAQVPATWTNRSGQPENAQIGNVQSPQSQMGERQRSSYSSFSSQHSKLDLRREFLASRQTSSTGSTSTTSGSIFTPPSSVSEASAAESPFDDPEDAKRLVAYCDIMGCTTPGTQHPIKSSDTWAKCNVCYDYDLCIKCHQSGKKDKGHQLNHKVSFIRTTRVFESENLTQANEAVNPQTSNPSNPERVNWVFSEKTDPDTGEKKTSKVLRLFSGNSHARFITDIRPGNYAVWMHLNFEFSTSLGPEALKTIRDDCNGIMRVSIGHVCKQREFRLVRYPEEQLGLGAPAPGSLPHRLFESFSSQAFKIPTGDIRYSIYFDALVKLPDKGSLPDLGVILQWSGAKEFSPTDPEPVLEVFIDNINLGDVINHRDPFTCATPRNVPEQVGSARRVVAAQTPSSTSVNSPDDDDDEEISLDDFLAAFNHVIQEIQDEQEKERQRAIFMERVKQQQDEAKRRLIIQAIEEAIQEQRKEEQMKLRQQQLRAQQIQQQNQAAQFVFFTTAAASQQARQQQLILEQQRRQQEAARQRRLQEQQEAEAEAMLAALLLASRLR